MEMANTTTYELGHAGAAGLGWIASARKALADYRLYRQTLGELEALSDRELQDINLSRFVIRQIAFDSVYGA
jgi:uncharacterized protein YjiS (DUF1127 family)